MVAVTFFSMFFGAGNLIFPPFVGALCGSRAVEGMVGFIISAVGLPILGVLVVASAGGFATLAARVRPGFATVLGVAIMLTIGPLFAIPRTASTSFEMAVAPFVPDGALRWVQLAYTLVFFALAFVIAQHPDKLTSVLGRIMGPLLLAMILVLFVACLFVRHPGFPAPSGQYAHDQLLQGFLDGYQTMDLLCALYFGIVISANVRQLGVASPAGNRRETGIAGAWTGVMLVVIYGALGFVGAVSGALAPVDGANDTGATVLTNLTSRTFGPAGTIFIGLIFVVACFNVCTGLISTCSSFFQERWPKLGYRLWSVIFTLVGLVIANIGLIAIIELAVPVLSALYPIAIVLVVLSLVHGVFSRRFPSVYFWGVLFAGIVSCAEGVVTLAAIFGAHLGWLSGLLDALPMHSISLGWVLPALVGVAVGMVVDVAKGMLGRTEAREAHADTD
ncbi:MAG: branched-chain amino acid transport system II carrier protein [Bifidobacterium sp.]|nr:branched-chain amino acid transport system II carrier protein [Bifidobacterium sp.]